MVPVTAVAMTAGALVFFVFLCCIVLLYPAVRHRGPVHYSIRSRHPRRTHHEPS